FKEIEEAHFTYVFPPSGPSPELNHKILDLCQQVGLKAFISDQRIRKDKPGLEQALADYSRHAALAGYFITDEPSAGEFAGLAQIVAHLKQRDPAHAAYINLLPNYARAGQLGAKDYDTYLRDFVEKVQPFALS